MSKRWVSEVSFGCNPTVQSVEGNQYVASKKQKIIDFNQE